MRIATYNVEWFAKLFSRNDKLLNDNKWSGRHDVTRAAQIEAIAKVFTALDADAIMVIEAPNSGRRQSTTRALEHFAQRFDLRANAALSGFTNNTQQEITLLFDPLTCSATHDPKTTVQGSQADNAAPRFDGALAIDLDVDTIHEKVRFSKPPLEVALVPHDGIPIRLIGVHVKSKAPHGATSVSEQIAISIENRRKQLAQCIWLRRRVDQHLDANEPIIVLGDLNDGPGLDEYENLFGRSGVEIVLGTEGDETRRLFDPSAAETLSRRSPLRPATSRFFIKQRDTYMNALLDYVMISQDLLRTEPRWQIWHPFDNPHCYTNVELRDALLTASDHFPVTLDIDLAQP